MSDIHYLMARLEFKKAVLKRQYPAKFGPQNYTIETAAQAAEQKTKAVRTPPKTFNEVFG